MCKYTSKEKTKNTDTQDGRIIHSHKLGFRITMSFSKWLCKFNGGQSRPQRGRVSMLVCVNTDTTTADIYIEV